MITQLLNENWRLNIGAEPDPVPAQVPGSVYGDLLRAGRLRDSFWRDGEMEALRWMERDFSYRCRFEPEPELLDCPCVLLRFEGIDTVADITLNGTPLGHVENMHRIFEYEVANLLHPGENTLTVEIHPPIQFIREGQCESVPNAVNGFPLLRKAHYMFGWGPRLPDAGIWRPVKLLGIPLGRIESVLIRQKHSPGQVALELTPEFSHNQENLSYSVTVAGPDGNIAEYPGSPGTIEIKDPRLWWPRGYGEQPLYTITVKAKAAGETVDVWQRRIGLRTVSVSIQPDEFGESFAHEVNGVKIFAMGAEYIPEDNLLSRVTPERTRRLLEDAAAANFNCIRVWGGGCFPDDFFYDICDELGLLVWQDFLFTRASYGLTPAFAENIRAEVRDNVKRLRHHPCLALWCGNNEIEMYASLGQFVKTPRQKADYIRLFEYIIPQELYKHDPGAFYWPSSPSSGGGFDEPNSLASGDAHPKCSDPRDPGRYVSDFGTPSCPCLPTIESFTFPQERNLFSRAMEKHSETPRHTAHVMANIQRYYLCPTSFDMAVYASQLAQAEILRSAAQRYRRHRGRCMGALYRRLNDPWPEVSCSSIDYTGRWKALHYFARRFFAPVLLSCEEPSMLTQNPDINAEPYEMEKSVRFAVTNETCAPRHVMVKWALRNQHSRIKREETISLTVPALRSAWLDKVELPEADIFTDFVSYGLYENGVEQSFETVLFVQPKYFKFLNPGLSCRVEGDEIVVSSQAYVQGVELQNAGEDLVLSDNYFDMLPGERRVKLLRGKPECLRVRSVYDIR